MMSRPDPYANATQLSTPLVSSVPVIGTTRDHKHLPQAGRRVPSASGQHALPTTAFTAFVGGGNNGKSNTDTYNRKRRNPGSQLPAAAAAAAAAVYEHENQHEQDHRRGHGRSVGTPIPGSPKAGPVVGSHLDDSNLDYRYHSKGRQQAAAIESAARHGVGGETYHRLLPDSIDNDIDPDKDEDEDEGCSVEPYDNSSKASEDGGIPVSEEQRQRRQLGARQLKSTRGSDRLYERGALSVEPGPDSDRLRSRPPQPRSRTPQAGIRSSVNHSSNWDRNKNRNLLDEGGRGFDSAGVGSRRTAPASRIVRAPGTVSAGGSGVGSDSSSSYTHPDQDTSNAYNRHRQSRQASISDHVRVQASGQATSQASSQTTSQPGRRQYQQHHQSVSSSNYPDQPQGRRYNPPRQRHRHQHQQQNPTHPRAASSLAFYTSTKPSPSPSPTTPPSSPPASRTRSASRTSPPTAPPRVSSLLPPPRSTALTNASLRPPLSSASTVAAAPIVLGRFGQLALPARPGTGSHAHPNSSSNSSSASSPDAVSTTLVTPSTASNALRSPTHAQFATSFLDPLNNHATLADASVLASGAGERSAAALSAGPGPGPGPDARRPSHSRANSFGTAADSVRALNRWSSSTASSRLSIWDYHYYQQQQARQQKATTVARRMSADSIARTPQHPDSLQESLPPKFSSPRKLSKRRPSEGSSASPNARRRTGSHSRSGSIAGGGVIVSTRRDPSPSPQPPSSAPPPNLPPIISLPPLDTDPESSFRLELPLGHAMGRASPGLNTPNSIFASQRGNVEPPDYFWSESNHARMTPPAMNADSTLLPPAPVTRDRDAVPERRGHSRSRSAAKGGSGDSTRTKDRSSSKPSQKAMLSKALNMANAAVELDNAQNYGAAREAYVEACGLLQQVLARTNGEDDRKKLDAIRRTYTSRIEELEGLLPVDPHGGKALPARPDSFDYHGVQLELAGVDNQSDAATMTRPHRDESLNSKVSSQPLRRPSEPAITYNDFTRNAERNLGRRRSTVSRSPMRRNFEGNALTIPRSDNFLPAPLSPHRPLSPARAPSPEAIVRQDFSLPSERERRAVASDFRSHRRNLSHESASWLDPIDESGGSTTSSVHSRSSSRIMRKHFRQPSGNTEAEFDAALDAAVEAAYDDGYDVMESSTMNYDEIDEDRVATSMRRVEMAKELVRQTERDAAIEMARERERQRQMSLDQQSQTYGVDFYDANDSDEEEERVFDEISRGGYVMEDFAMGQPSRYKTSIPRESDSSGLTSRTWHSSMGSNPPTGTTTFSAVSEKTSSGNLRKTSSPPMPPPTQSLPQPPLNRPSSTTGVRTRRLSGQNMKQLKIETSKLGPPPAMPPPINTSDTQSLPTSSYIAQQRQALSAVSTRPGPFSMRTPSSPVRGVSPADVTGPASPPEVQDNEVRTGSPSTTRPPMRKNFSSSSLKSLKSRQISLSHLDDADPLPMTPLSQQVSNSSISRLPMMPTLPTPLVTTFADRTMGGIGGLHLFDSDFHSPVVQSPNSTPHHQQQNPDVPLTLEPCPTEPMFRPFWLMRALYQTLAHPRGGYISNRLFVPQDAWKVKGVKLRNIEDKTFQCDLLTAALQKLARVDSTDADALLDEMQNFEYTLEQVQATLSRRLGAEVGTQGMGTFKDEKEMEAPVVPRNNSISGKGGAFSWRRLRSKGSAVNLASTYGLKTNTTSGSTGGVPGIPEKDVISPGGSMPSLPMVAHPSSRPAKRDVTSVRFDGPNANYMASLARLFDAAQTVDQIARQVDDPGLRHADKTQVGLELCTRHAAEFFGFYICRFVMTDLGMLLDKFVKRGTEWVLS